MTDDNKYICFDHAAAQEWDTTVPSPAITSRTDMAEKARELVSQWDTTLDVVPKSAQMQDLIDRIASDRQDVHDAATLAERERLEKVINERRKWYDESLFGPMPSMEHATESEKRLVTLASANMARHTCDHLLEELAAITSESK